MNDSSRLLSESKFINSVLDKYALFCTNIKSLSNKNNYYV